MAADGGQSTKGARTWEAAASLGREIRSVSSGWLVDAVRCKEWWVDVKGRYKRRAERQTVGEGGTQKGEGGVQSDEILLMYREAGGPVVWCSETTSKG